MKYNSKLSIYKVKKIIKFFCTDIDATKTAILLELNRNTYNIFRQEIMALRAFGVLLKEGLPNLIDLFPNLNSDLV